MNTRPEAVALSLERRAKDGTLHTRPDEAAAAIRELIAERDELRRSVKILEGAVERVVPERDVLKARIRDGWTVRRMSLYDEDGVAGWCWDGPSGEEVYQIAWDSDLPSIPDEWGKS